MADAPVNLMRSKEEVERAVRYLQEAMGAGRKLGAPLERIAQVASIVDVLRWVLGQDNAFGGMMMEPCEALEAELCRKPS